VAVRKRVGRRTLISTDPASAPPRAAS